MELHICRLSAIPMRKDPSDKSEIVNQVLYGETMSILDETDKWYLIQLHHDQYTGWVDKKQIMSISTSFSLKQAEVVDTLFRTVVVDGITFHVPAGSFVHKSDIAEINTTKSTQTTSKINVEKFSKMFLESPYLWGGRTFMGVDCSGLTQIVFRLLGLSLPRDAYQQAEHGKYISFVEESKTGDLAFFDNAEGRIVHVGIILREKTEQVEIIHASGKVRIDKLDHQGIFNDSDKAYSHQLRTIKRIIL